MFKHTIIFAVIAGLVLALAPAAQAALITHQSFEGEALGAFDGATDQTWTPEPAYGGGTWVIVDDSGLTYTGGDVSVPGGTRAVRIGVGKGKGYWLPFSSAQTADPIYFSFLAQAESGTYSYGAPSDTADRNSSLAGCNINTTAGDVVQPYIDGIAGGDRTVGDDIGNAVGAPFFVVGKVSKSGTDAAPVGDYDTLELSFNPTSTSVPTWDTTLVYDSDSPSFGGFWLGKNWSDDALFTWVDEIRVGTEYGDVVVPEPATMALLAFGGLGLLMRRRRRA